VENKFKNIISMHSKNMPEFRMQYYTSVLKVSCHIADNFSRAPAACEMPFAPAVLKVIVHVIWVRVWITQLCRGDYMFILYSNIKNKHMIHVLIRTYL
jgi:hypothetical protein